MFARPKTYIVNITQNQHLEEADAGKLGMAKSRLAATGVMIPDTFIITSTAFDDFITSANLVDPISALLDKLTEVDAKQAERASAEIQKLILNANFPTIVLNPLVQAYKELSGYTDKYVSIKPSWILSTELVPESITQYSFQNVRGEGSLLYHIKQAWASLFSPDALLKRIEYGYQGGLSVAVVVQRLIQPEVSGLAFSSAPIEMDDSIIEIEALLGMLPDDVPQDLHADLYKIDSQHLQVTEKHILEQDYMLLRKGRAKDDEDPIIKVDISSEWRRKQKLHDAAIVDLAEVTKFLSESYQHPVELRWVYETGNIYVTDLAELTKLGKERTQLSKFFAEAEATPGIQIEPASAQPKAASKPQVDLDSLVNEVNEMIDQTVADQPTLTPEVAQIESEPVQAVEELSAKESEIVEKATEEILHAERQEPQQVESPEVPVAEPVPPPKRKRGRPKKQTPADEVVVADTPVEATPVIPAAPPNVDSVANVGGSVMDKLPPELKAKIEAAAAQAPEAPTELKQPTQEPEKPEKQESEKSIVDEVEVEKLKAKPIVIKGPIKETYGLNTDVFLDISALDSGTLANGANFDGAYLDGTSVVMRHKILPESLTTNKEDLKKLIEAYALEISTAAKAIGTKPVLYSFSDIGDKERKELLGEVTNETGLDGSERFVLKPEALIAEVLAVKKAKNVYGANNLRVVLPKLRTEVEVIEMKKIMNSQNFTRSSVMQLFAEVATPSFLYELEHTEGSDLDGVVVNLPKLAKGMTGRSEFVVRDHKAILSAIKLMMDFNRTKQFHFMLKMGNDPELVQAIFEDKILSAAFIFNEIPTEETLKVIKNFELEPLKAPIKRGRKPKELKSDIL